MKTQDRERKEAGGCRPEAIGWSVDDQRAAVRKPLVVPEDHPPTHDAGRTTHNEPRATTCSNCVYARRPAGRWLRLILSRWMGLLLCTNHPDFPGDVIGVPPCSRCRNYRRKPDPIERPEVPDQTGLLVCTVPLTRKKVALVDAIDYERVSRHKWCAYRTGNVWYAQCRTHSRTIRMHQFIMNPPKGMVVDHANGNGLDNRRDNLRLCTQLENAWNHGRRKPEGAGSQYIGVYPCQRPPGKWCIRVQRDGQVTNLSPFDTPEEAARVRDRKALELHGEYAWLNFPEEREQRLREIEEERKRRDTDSHG